jgi:hypothetical protein
MTSAPRRDPISCRACKAEIGTINRRTSQMTFRPGVALLVIRALRVDAICPECGTVKSVYVERCDVVARAAKPPMLESA